MRFVRAFGQPLTTVCGQIPVNGAHSSRLLPSDVFRAIDRMLSQTETDFGAAELMPYLGGSLSIAGAYEDERSTADRSGPAGFSHLLLSS